MVSNIAINRLQRQTLEIRGEDEACSKESKNVANVLLRNTCKLG